MGSNEELSDLDLELLGEKRSTPVNTNERPATSPAPVRVVNTNERPATSPAPTKVVSTKAPTQPGFTNKSRSSTSPAPVKVVSTKAPTQPGFTNKSSSSTSPDRVHVFGTTSPVRAGFTINSVHLPSVFGPVNAPKALQKPTTDTKPLPSDRDPIFTSRMLPTPTTEATPLATGHRSDFTPAAVQTPPMSAQGMPDKADSTEPKPEDSNKTKQTFTRAEVMDELRKRQKADKVAKDLVKKLSDRVAELTDQHLKTEEELKEELKETSKRLSSSEGERVELNHRYTRAEEALRVKVEQAVKDGKRTQVTEETFEKLKTEIETLKKANTALEHKAKTQTNQVVGCEKKVTKTLKDLADFKAAAEAKEARLKQSNANLKKGVEDSRKLIQSSGIEQRRAEIDDLSAHVDSFEESRIDWVNTQNQLEDDLAAVKASLDEKEQMILSMVEENKKLVQAKKDLKKANQDLRLQQNTPRGSIKEAQASSKLMTQGGYSTDEDQGSLDKKLQRSMGEHFNDFGIQSGNDEASEEEEKTVTIRNLQPPSTNESWIPTEENKTVTLGEFKPIATGKGWTPAQTPNVEYSPLFHMESAPVPPTGTPPKGPKLERSPIFAVSSAPVSMVRDPAPTKATHSQGVQTELESTQSQVEQTSVGSTQSQGVQTDFGSTQSQGVQTDLGSTQSQGVQTDLGSTQSQGVQTEPRATESKAVQTELRATQSQGVQTELRATQSQGVQTEPRATESKAVQTELRSTQSQGVQTEPRATESKGVQTELRATESKAVQTELKSTKSQGVQTEFRYTRSQGVQTEPRATKSRAVQTEPEQMIIPNEKKPWYMRTCNQAIFGAGMVSGLLMLLFWAWSQCQAVTKERKMWMQANDHAYRLSDEVIRKQAIALLLRTSDRARLGWLTPEKIMTLHRGAHQAFTHTFQPLVLPTRSISTASLVQSAMAPTPATTRFAAWPAWGDSP